MDGTSNLAGASRELAFLANLFGANSRLVGSRDFSSLTSLVNHYQIIHFAGHAGMDHGKPRLVFPSPWGESYLDASSIEKWKLTDNSLVTLAGCNSGIGERSPACGGIDQRARALYSGNRSAPNSR